LLPIIASQVSPEFSRARRSSTAETLQKIAGISVTAVNNIPYKGFKSREIREQFLVKDNNGVTHGIKGYFVFSDAGDDITEFLSLSPEESLPFASLLLCTCETLGKVRRQAGRRVTRANCC
jgi:hypothetical protein